VSDPQFRLVGASGEEAPIVTATGDIDLANVNEFQDMITKAASGASALTVDLSEVSYCDSSAVRALFSVAAITKLSLVVRSEGPIRMLLSVSGLDRVATVTAADR
jgi:anti-sigma B factor antagonist